jgi:hypothetical protein
MLLSLVDEDDDKIGPLKCVRLLSQADKLIGRHVPADAAAHGNQELDLPDALRVLLAAFFNPVARSLRLIELLSQKSQVNEHTSVKRTARSTLSDALARFDPERLRPLIAHLRSQLPALKRIDSDLECLTRKLIAADGSYFNLAGEVAWAMSFPRGPNSQDRQPRVRLNLQLDVESFLPEDCDVSGGDDGSEAAAFARKLKSNAVYIVDRNFNHFGFLRAVLEKGSSFVVRMKSSSHVQAITTCDSRPLTPRDMELGVRSDRLVTLGTTHNTRARRTGRPPTQTLREVVVWDEKNKQEIRLLTDLLDVPAYVIGLLYRLRWQIELFLRWIKVFAAMEHLISFSKNGVTIQFYVAVIACLLMYLNTGRRPSKYLLFEMQLIASGMSTLEEAADSLAHLERERELAALRAARKKASQKTSA